MNTYKKNFFNYLFQFLKLLKNYLILDSIFQKQIIDYTVKK